MTPRRPSLEVHLDRPFLLVVQDDRTGLPLLPGGVTEPSPHSMSKKAPPPSELVDAATSLDAELARFESLTRDVLDAPISAQKHLEQMARLLNDVASSDERLVQHMRALMAALSTRRETQQRLAAEVNARAQELQQRTSVFQALMQRFAELGQQASALSAEVQEVFARTQVSGGTPNTELIEALQGVSERLGAVAEQAGALSRDAEGERFNDVARDGQALRQQLLDARNKVGLLQRKLHPVSA